LSDAAVVLPEAAAGVSGIVGASGVTGGGAGDDPPPHIMILLLHVIQWIIICWCVPQWNSIIIATS
jgi:hypothetical protein